MYATERQNRIWEMLQSRGRVEVTDLAERFDVSSETIRRDLKVMESSHLVKRVHGGALATNRLRFEAPLAERAAQDLDEKDRIARAARNYLPSKGAIFLDAGSTTGQLAFYMSDLDLTVATNSITTALELARWPQLVLLTLGGRVRPETLAEVDDWALRSLADLRVDVAFLGANAVSVARGLGTPDPSEAAVKRAILNCADTAIVLADHTKLQSESLLSYGRLRDINTLITGREADTKVVQQIRESGVQVLLA